MSRLRLAAAALPVELGWLTDLATWREALERLLTPALPPAPTPTLVVLPEHTGLLALLIGPRAAAARAALADGADLATALGALAAGYPDELAEVVRRWPEPVAPGAWLQLAATDALVRGTVETAAALARAHGWWVAVSAALPAWRGDPTRGYEPLGPVVRNRCVLVGPDGRTAAVQDKATLVAMERDQVGGLGLTPAQLPELTVAELPIGRVASVISKDAWMPDVNDRLDQLGAELLLQPEAFEGWVTDPSDGAPWPPDGFQRGGWWMVQRQPSFQANITAVLVGRLGDLVVDGQPSVAVPGPDGSPGLALLGQRPAPGWAAVGRWGGTTTAGTSLTDPTRRAWFSGLPDVNGDPGVAVTEVALPARPPAGVGPPLPEVTAPASVAVVDAGTGMVPDLAGDGATVALCWVGWDSDHDQTVRVATAPTGSAGGHWTQLAPLHPRPRRHADPSDRRWRPRVAVVAGVPTVIALDHGEGSWDVTAGGWEATSVGGASDGDREPTRPCWGPVRVDDAEQGPDVTVERLHDTPVLVTDPSVTDRSALVAVWSDLRAGRVLPELRWAHSEDGGRSWGPAQPVAAPLADGGQTLPSVAAVAGRLLVAFQDHDGAGVPTVRLAWLAEGPPAPALTVPGPPGGARRPVLVPVAAGCRLVVEHDDGQGGSALVVHDVALPDPVLAPVGPGRVLDPSRPEGTRQRRAAAASPGIVVAEDDRDGRSRIVGWSLGDALPAVCCPPPVRLDDTPPGADARAPTVWCRDELLVVAWQDTRRGSEQVRSRRVPRRQLAVGRSSPATDGPGT